MAVKPKRRVVPGGPRSGRTPTVRRVKPAIRPVGLRPPSAGPAASRPEAVPSGPVPTTPGVTSPALDALGGRPVELAVDLGRGLVLPTPVFVASGPFGYGVEVADLVDLTRLGGIITRGTTLRPRSGHPAPRVVEVAGGLLVGVGLANPGIDVVLERYGPTWAGWPVPVVLNLCGDTTADLAEAARRLDGATGVSGVEVNLSCGAGRGGSVFGLAPDSAAGAITAVRRATDLPLIAKLTPAAADIRAVARACEQAGADAISAVNTLPALALAADRQGPALGSGYGGLCGPALRPVALRAVFEVAQVVDVPVLGIGGVATVDDVLDLLAAGAAAVGVGVAALADPTLPVTLADELADACRARGLRDHGDLVGTALPPRLGPPSTRGAEYAR